MNPPSPDLPPDTAQRVGDVLEYSAKTAISVGIVWAFIAKIAKPFIDWRQKRLTAAIRGVMQEELSSVRELADDMDLFVRIVADARERLDEMAGMLDVAGFASRDRRDGASERRQQADEALAELQGRLRSRRRQDDQPSEPSP